MLLHIGILMWIFADVSKAWVKDMETPGFYEGDMVLSPDQIEEVINGTFQFGTTSHSEKLWPDNKKGTVEVPYHFESSISREIEAIKEIRASFAQYHKYTCIRFIPWGGGQSYISFYNHNGGCSSPVGRNCRYGKCERNRISLSKGCWWRATIMHEIGHSLGLHHEQSRPDRDNYVKILEYNIHPTTLFNFRKQSSKDVDSLGSPYDYLSMMHYSWNAFGKDQKMTIKTADPRYQYEIGQDEGFSQTDIDQLNKLYKCRGTYPKLPPYVLPPQGCYDLGGACGKGKHEGHCTHPSWRTYMHSKCRKSCGLCGNGKPQTGRPVTFPPVVTKKPENTFNPEVTFRPTGTATCRDRVVDCHRLGRFRCTDPNSSWRNYMKRSCRRFCSFC